MAFYGFRLDEIYCIYQRGKVTDSDVVMFAAAVDEQSSGGVAGRFVMGSGEHVPASAVAPDVPGKFGLSLGGWIVGPFEAGDGDKVTLTFCGVNQSDTPVGADQEFAGKYELPALDALIAAAAAAGTGGLAALGEGATLVAEGLGAIAGKIGKITETLLGYSDPVACDGLVFQYAENFQGSELAALAYTESPAGFGGQFAKTIHTDDSTNHPSGCGHIAETDVTFSILNFGDSLSLRYFSRQFWPNVDLRKGVRQLVPAGKATSLKALLCA